MKPTQEQAIQWAQEAGLHIATDVHWMPIIGLKYIEKVIALAYEAGRKDENEACAKLCELADDDEFYFGKNYAEGIRARREQ